MRDEFAKIPSPEEHEAANAHAEQLTATKETNNSSQDESEPAFYEDMMSEFQSTILSVSPYVKFQPPHLLMRARDLEVRLHNLKRLREHDNRQLTNAAPETGEPQDEKQDQEKTKSQRFLLVSPEMIDGSSSVASLKQREVLQAVHNAEYERSYHVYQAQKRQWENYILGNINMFDPFAHQNIVVLYSILNTKTFAPCVGPEMLTFGYYDETEGDTTFEADCTL
ncbi:1-phosphatidylinositol-3-phosphate 5-kinase, partial [Ascosphaera atra]